MQTYTVGFLHDDDDDDVGSAENGKMGFRSSELENSQIPRKTFLPPLPHSAQVEGGGVFAGSQIASLTLAAQK